jgi:uncharacterized protein
VKRITITGGTGRLGRLLVERLEGRGDEVTILSRDPAKGVRYDPLNAPAPPDALAGRDAVVHLAGEGIAQRWNDETLRRIKESRMLGTRNLVAGIAQADPRPRALISASAVGYYGNAPYPIDEDAPPGDDVLADVCVAWEREADKAAELGLRVVKVRTGVVLDRHGGALQKMLLPFRLGVGGPVAGGRQYIPWIHADDLVGIYLAASDGGDWTGPVNATAPEPVTNRAFSRALGRALRRPAVLPIPGAALRLLYGDMAEIVTTGQRAVPRRPLELGYAYRHPDLDEALRDALRS